VGIEVQLHRRRKFWRYCENTRHYSPVHRKMVKMVNFIVFIVVFFKDKLFRVILGSQQNRESYRFPSPHVHSIHLPHQSVTFVAVDEPTLTLQNHQIQ
jgi:hypothetical protein